MPTDAVTIVIEADDKASAQASNAAKNIEQSVRGVKDMGQKAKASTEFVGILAGQLGGSQLQSAAQGVAAITEKVGQFAEVQKLGGAGATAFKAGIGALVAVMSFQLGKSIGEAIFGVQELSDEFAQAQADADAFTKKLIDLSERDFKNKLEDISLIRDPQKQQQEAVAAFDAIQKKINAAYDAFHYRQTEIEKLRQQGTMFGGVDQDRINELQLESNQLNTQIDAYEKQKWAISDLYGERANQVKLIKEQQKLEDEAAAKQKQRDDKVKSALDATNNKYIELTQGVEEARKAQLAGEGITGLDATAIIIAERKTRLAQEEADAKKKAQDDEKARLEKLNELRKSETDRIEEQKVLLSQGEQAAHSFRLQQQGLAKDEADRIAAEQAGIDKIKKQKELAGKIAEKPALMAFESRLTMRGPSEDTQKNIAENTLKTVDKLDEVKTAIQNIPKAQAAEGPQVTMVA